MMIMLFTLTTVVGYSKIVHPNPASTHINIEIDDYSLTANYSIQIVSLLGQEVFNQTFKATNINIDINDLSSGVYFIYIRKKWSITK